MTAVPASVRRMPSATVLAYGIVVALVALSVVGVLGRTLRQPAPEQVPVPLNPAVEAKWGLRVSQVAVTADGGLVDFRFVVLDPDKVAELMSSVDNLPVLLPSGTSTVVNSASQMGVPHTLIAGQTYFLLYRNADGAITRGATLAIQFGDLKIENVVAR
jgi:hypothetical protein